MGDERTTGIQTKKRPPCKRLPPVAKSPGRRFPTPGVGPISLTRYCAKKSSPQRRIWATAVSTRRRGPRRGQSESLGVVFTESLIYAVTDPASLLFLHGVAYASEPGGVSLILLPTPLDPEAGSLAVRNAVVDGFFVYSVAENDPRLQAVRERALPVVIVDGPPPEDVAYVGIDDREGGFAVAEHLLGLGHRSFAVITFSLIEDSFTGLADRQRQSAMTFGVSRERIGGYADAPRGAGLDWDTVPVHERSVNTLAAGENAAGVILDRHPRPIAILAFSDVLALGALRAAAARGLAVPGALSIAGFDDIPAAARASPALTTVHQPFFEKGRLAATWMLEGWPEDDPPSVLFPAPLVVRASTGPAPR